MGHGDHFGNNLQYSFKHLIMVDYVTPENQILTLLGKEMPLGLILKFLAMHCLYVYGLGYLNFLKKS